ncbi:CubicO group peptidase, beta-lactamase class C family [Maribacter aquivivus]|uniref:CubicO group peptidase, beta-lactamase class C family n=1 Tax=Maribacter aquivivus TaxID=228958 RepID=A0A1M6MFL5_9FLAO|nr:serine hydrolase [Maribacter aquivivus]SHJ82282.1 CubicO group peptidase, beta-lactamase class C family [Maribacter aquivivus]
MIYRLFYIGILFILLSCQSDDSVSVDSNEPNPTETSTYFPPINTNDWENVSPSELNWNVDKLSELEDFLIQDNTKSFMVLVDGKIVVEEYYNDHTVNDTYQWNSAGKTLVTATTGIAQQNGLIDIDNKVSDYIGTEWTSATIQQENLITVKSLLTMTSGLDDEPQLVIKANLVSLSDAGTRWAYGNVFQRLMNVVEDASGTEFETYFNTELAVKIGMDGFWNNGFIYRIYHSNTRSMARFGLLASQNGKWDGEQIVDEDFFLESTTTSQDINPAYGYLWWLNGKSDFMLPSTQTEFSGSLIPNAPADMIAALGKDEQRIYIVPSENLVIIRMGEATGSEENFALSSFDNVFWEKFNEVTN